MNVKKTGLFRALDISASGMTAERMRLNVIAANIANAEVTKTPEGGPYRRKVVSFAPLLEDMIQNADPSARAATGVRISEIKGDPSEFPSVYRPGHPDADKNGNVQMPNVTMTFEMIDMMTAMRAYEANMIAAKTFKDMATKAIQMGR